MASTTRFVKSRATIPQTKIAGANYVTQNAADTTSQTAGTGLIIVLSRRRKLMHTVCNSIFYNAIFVSVLTVEWLLPHCHISFTYSHC